MDAKRPVTILLVEDDPGHARLIEKNLQRANITNPIVKLDDGQKAVDFLFSEGEYSGAALPSPLLVLLDLNLPVLNGHQVLKRMKEDPRTRRIPVIILTTTEDSREVHKCYEMGCNVFISKPVEYEQFTDAVIKIGLFISIVQIPNGE